MLLSRIAVARRRESLSTALSTTVLEEKMRASLSWKTTMRQQVKRPITVEVTIETPVANLAPLLLPAPSSIATRTLWIKTNKYHVT